MSVNTHLARLGVILILLVLPACSPEVGQVYWPVDDPDGAQFDSDEGDLSGTDLVEANDVDPFDDGDFISSGDVDLWDATDGSGEPFDRDVIESDLVPDGDDQPNEGWIGDACESDQSCHYDQATCLTEGYPEGMCSLACERLCPNSDDPNDAITFCIEDLGDPGVGICVSRCDWNEYPETGCRQEYLCQSRSRLGEPDVTRPVCLPDHGSSEVCTADHVPQPNLGRVEPVGIDGCPSGMTPIASGDVCIDRWEPFLVEVLENGQTLPWSPYFNPGDVRVRAVSAPDAVPQGYIDALQAQAACEEAGKRLCTRAEWELACRGPEGNVYPYGNTRQPGVCNDSRTPHPVVEFFGTSDDWIWSQLGHPCINQLEDSLDPTGANPGCVTSDVAYDMMGNLHEWIDDPAGTFKGGFYVDTVINGEGCLYTTTAHNVYHWDYSTGFRCCAER